MRAATRLTLWCGAALAAFVAVAPAGWAQTAPDIAAPNVADLRADLDAMTADLHSLRGALRVSGAAGYAAAGGPSVIARLDVMEAELRRLTGQIEEARNRIEQLTRLSAGRLEDLEFRLCQLEEHCDLGDLLTPSTGETGLVSVYTGSGLGAVTPGPDLAGLATTAEERSDFETAQRLAAAGDHAGAARAFGAVASDHAGGPLFAEARFREGQALEALGERHAASRAWIDVFAADPAGPRAPAALLGMGRVVGEEGQRPAACLILGELALRFGDRPEAAEAEALRSQLDCASLDAAELAAAAGAAQEPALDDPEVIEDLEAIEDLAPPAN